MKITDGVYSFESAKFGHSCHVFYIAEERALIDTGFPGQGQTLLDSLIQEALPQADEPPQGAAATASVLAASPAAANSVGLSVAIQKILLTHHDVDHVGNVRFFEEATGADIYIGDEDRPYLLGEKIRPGRKGLLQKLLRVRPPLGRSLIGDADGKDGKTGGIAIMRAPGHTAGHRCFQYKDIIFTGDLFRTKGGQILAMKKNEDEAALRATLLSLKDRPFALACPSHGEPVSRDAVTRFIDSRYPQ